MYTFPTRWSPRLSQTFISSISPYCIKLKWAGRKWKTHYFTSYLVFTFCKYIFKEVIKMFLGFFITHSNNPRNCKPETIVLILKFTKDDAHYTCSSISGLCGILRIYIKILKTDGLNKCTTIRNILSKQNDIYKS